MVARCYEDLMVGEQRCGNSTNNVQKKWCTTVLVPVHGTCVSLVNVTVSLFIVGWSLTKNFIVKVYKNVPIVQLNSTCHVTTGTISFSAIP